MITEKIDNNQLCVSFKEAIHCTKEEIGKKGCGIAAMYQLGIPCPDGFFLKAEFCRQYYQLPEEKREEYMQKLSDMIEAQIHILEHCIGKSLNIDGLHVSVRSSAPVSMPGILVSYCNISSVKEVLSCIEKVILSWNSNLAKRYRKKEQIPDTYGTAVVIQQMVNGTASKTSGTGVCYSKNPSTGENKVFGEFLPMAQGEDVVSGRKTPYRLELMKQFFPDLYAELENYAHILEQYYGAIQEIEFTIEDNKLYFLQTRKARCSSFVQNKLENNQCSPFFYKEILTPVKQLRIGEGIPLGVGDITGRAVSHLQTARIYKEKGENVIFVCQTLSIHQIEAFFLADGIISATGGVTSHAAALALGADKRCITGCQSLLFKNGFYFGTIKVEEGELLTLDMKRGYIYKGALSMKSMTNTEAVTM